MNIASIGEEFLAGRSQTDCGVNRIIPKTTLLNALVSILESISKYYEESGLPRNIVMGLFNRVTRVRITDSPVVIKDNEFQAVMDERDSETVLETFKRVLLETHKAMAVLLGSKVVSTRYQDAYGFLTKKYLPPSPEADILALIPPDKASI